MASNINHKQSGKIYIASMNLRGIRAPKPHPNCLSLNVTSAQARDAPERHDFSPMSAIEGGYKGYFCFENYWQSGKVFEGIPHQQSQRWWLSLKEPKRRYPMGKGRKVLYAIFNGQQYGYIESRKHVYVPEYYQLILNKPSLIKWQNLINQGHDVVIYDFDGPRSSTSEPLCLELTKELLIDKINDSTHPFGHGYVVGATLMGLVPQDYVQ
ncbi:MAG: hypothetical protein ABIN35_00170 [candidate division WOR-3 bacterium]